jgi:hypothetical protein
VRRQTFAARIVRLAASKGIISFASQPFLRHGHPRLHVVLDRERPKGARRPLDRCLRGFIKTQQNTPYPGIFTSSWIRLSLRFRATPGWCHWRRSATRRSNFSLTPRYVDSTEPETCRSCPLARHPGSRHDALDHTGGVSCRALAPFESAGRTATAI